MEYFKYINNRLCVAARWLYESDLGGVISRANYDKQVVRGRVNVVVPGKGLGAMAMVEYDSIRPDIRIKVEDKLGCHPRDLVKDNLIINYYEIDEAALDFYSKYTYGETGKEKSLPAEIQLEYRTNANVLNAIRNVLNSKRQIAALIGGKAKNAWPALTDAVKDLKLMKGADKQSIYPHSLSDNERVLQRQYKQYIDGGYCALIHKNYGNDHAKKVTELIEELLLSIYAMEEKPYISSKYNAENSVHGIYLQFLGGGLELVNVKTGEFFNRSNFFDKTGNAITISAMTVHNYIKKLENSNAVEKLRNSELYWNAKHRPIHHRHAPEYSFSKLTMDDIAIPFKRPDGTRIWAYQVFDTLSTCVVGRSYSKDKCVDMLIDSLKDMMRLCVRNEWGFPGEMECEQHLANTLTGKENEDGSFEEDLLTAGTLFPFVSFQRGGMPQGKRAEGFIKTKKYQQQSKRKGFQRRPFSRLEVNRLNTDKNTTRYTLKEIIANEETDINSYNNSLHPDQERFPGQTRWQVLIENINPELPRHPMAVLAFHLGECEPKAAIHRSQWVRVNKKDYLLPSPTIIKRLKSLKVQAYYIPTSPQFLPTREGQSDEVYLYQDGRYVCTCVLKQDYNEAKIERTEVDEAIKLSYEKNVAKFDKMTRETIDRITKLEIIHPESVASKLEDEPEGNSPIHGEFNEPDLETVKQEQKAYRKVERQRAKTNTNTKSAFFDMVKGIDFGD